ncbi:MAG TPA: type II secretion system minor pseudopilin GspI [Rudaea sp.]|nr:type II secretion system minor pseudopilin GspI [Rudaea sp.]
MCVDHSPPPGRSCGRQRGFTLLEVLIALLVLALALLGLSRTAANQVNSFDAWRQRTVAGWLASDVLTQTRLTTPFPPAGTSDGERRFGGGDWHWQLIVQTTPVDSLRRLDVRVYAGTDRSAPLAGLTGFSGTDLQQ